MQTLALPSTLSPLARQLARLDKINLCGPRLLPGQIDTEMKRNPQFRAHIEGARRCGERGAEIVFAFRAARAELDTHESSKATKGGTR